MAKKYFYRYTVEGTGEFPFDMLRYDASYPATEVDSYAIGDSRRARKVTLCHGGEERNRWMPTIGRWSSFTWCVHEDSVRRID